MISPFDPWSALSALPAALLVIDNAERIVHANAAATKLFQKLPTSITGARCGDLFSCCNRHAHPLGCGHSVNCQDCPIIQHVRKRLSIEQGPRMAGIVRLHCDHGPSSRWLDYQVGGLETEGHRFALLIVQDITTQKEGEGRFQALIDSGPTMIWTSGLDMLCDYFNRPWLAFTGRKLEQELGTGWLESVHPDDKERCMHIYTTAFRLRHPFEMVYRMRRHDGDYRWVEDIGLPRFDGSGDFVGYIGHCLDVTYHVQAEAALEQLNADLALRAKVAERFLADPEDRLFANILDLLMEAFGSRDGFLGYVDRCGDLVCPSLTHSVWEKCRISGKSIVFPKASWGGLWGKALQQKRSLFCNAGLQPPSGHLPLENALVVPLLVGAQRVGLIVVGNKSGGYNVDDQHRLEALAAFIAPILGIHLEKQEARRQLKESVDDLKNKNIALNVLLDHRAEQMQQAVDGLLQHFERLVMPYLSKMEKTAKREELSTYLDIVQKHIREILSPLESSTNTAYRRLSSAEIQVADLVRAGKTSKEIAQALHISPRSVYFHRNNIRRKMKIANTRNSLKSFLQNL